MITIDLSRCIGCGACVKDCLMANLKLEGGTVTAGERCILCGHCVAVCPKNAVSLSGCAMEETEEYDPETFTVEPRQFLHPEKYPAVSENHGFGRGERPDFGDRPVYGNGGESPG